MENVIKQSKKEIEIWDNSKRAKAVLYVFWALTGVTILGVVSGYWELQLLEKAQLSGFVDENEANASDLRQGVIGVVQMGLYVASAVVFLRWFRRAYGNLHRTGINHLEHRESMALWSWFIPIIFLFRPVQIMNEIWDETQEKIKKYDASYVFRKGGGIILSWWILFIISHIVGRYLLKTAFEQDTLDQLIESSQATLFSDVIQIPEAILVMVIVYKLSQIETKLANEVESAGGNVVHK